MYLFLLLKKIEIKGKKERRQLGIIVYIWSRWFVPDSHLHLLCRALFQENTPLQSLHILFQSKLEYYSLLTKPEEILRNYFACVLSHFSHVRLFETPWTAASQTPLSMGVSRQEGWSGLPCPPPGDLHPTHIFCDSCIAGRFLTSEPLGKPQEITLRRTTTTKIKTSKILALKFLGRRTGNRLFYRFLIPLKDFYWALISKVLYTTDKLIKNN